MRVDDVDPRDTRWEVDRPVYRVYFWWQPHPGPDVMWHCHEHRLHDARDVDAVLQWAARHADGRSAVVYVEARDGGEPGLLRLHGEDPNVATSRLDVGPVASASG